METLKAICINDKGRPADYVGPWIEKGTTYTVTKVVKLVKHHMALGFQLEEVQFPEGSKYKYFLAARFRPQTEDDENAEAAFEELMESIAVTVLD